MKIHQVDPEDLAAITAFHRIQVEIGRHDRPGGPAPPIKRTVEALRGESGLSVTAFLGWHGDAPVASGWCGAYGEPRWAYVIPRVLPQFRRRGYGTAMLQSIEAQGPIRGCALQSTGTWEGSHGPEGHGSAAAGFASQLGWELVRVEARSRLALPVPTDRLDALAAERAERRRGYTISAWAGPLPDALVEGWDALGRPQTASPSPGAVRQRNEERLLAERGEVKFSAVALSPDGAVVAGTFLTVGPAGPTGTAPASQQRTFVSPAHRGRGLGLAMKLDLLALLERDRPDIPAIVTRNDMTNAPILALNGPLGYVRTAYSGTFRKGRL